MSSRSNPANHGNTGNHGNRGNVVVFYVSGHGFGHAIRQAEIINTLLDAAPGAVRVVVRTSAPAWLFTHTVRGPFELRHGETDTGVVQIDALRLSERDTIERATAFYRDLPRRLDEEATLLRASNAALVVADAPSMPCAAAAAAGMPSIVCANFTWDWIYAAYREAAPGADELIEIVQQGYRAADEAWRLPLHGGFESFDRIVDVPFVARHSRSDLSRDRIRAMLGLPGDARLALVSFGGYGVRDLPLDRLDCTGTWGIVLTAPGIHLDGLPAGVYGIAEERMYERGLHYEDVVRAVDVVVTKPGYGIISDCVANGAAMLYTPRGRFVEYDVMVREMPGYLRCEPLTLEDFGAGRWRKGLDAVAAKPAPPAAAATDGASLIARMILERLGG